MEEAFEARCLTLYIRKKYAIINDLNVRTYGAYMKLVSYCDLKNIELESNGFWIEKFDLLNRKLERWREIHNQFKVAKLKRKVESLILKSKIPVRGLTRRGPTLLITDFDYFNICCRVETP